MKKILRVLSVVLVAVVLVTSLTACTALSSYKILGSWRDSTGTTGYEFQKDNIVEITFVDVTLPFVGEFNGSVDGIYTISKDDDGNQIVTITYTILTFSISNEYFFEISGSTLTLTDPEDGSSTTYIEYDPEITTAAE
ncbi:MAG: hypothetical protein R3Y27_03315 [Clostridia bacterium]